jgi:hypothetical protein
MSDRHVFAAGVILAAVAAGVVARADAGGTAPDPARTLARAITVDQALATSGSDASVTGPHGRPATVRDRQATLHRYFTGRALQVEVARLEPAGRPSSAPGVFAFGGGVRAFSVTRSSRLDDNTVVLTGRGTVWARVGQVQGDRTVMSTPSNDLVVTATLNRGAADVWRVADLSWKFAPGSAP